MEGRASVSTALWLVLVLLVPYSIQFVPAQVEATELGSTVQERPTEGRAQTTWSGTQTLTDSYTVAVSDELIIQACTVVQLPANERLIVDGRLTILGTGSCPVVFEASGLGDHEGIQFNSSSSGRGSIVQNLTIEDSIFGLTVYGSNPTIENLTVVNPDRVAVDLFNGAAPRISDLFVDRAGRELPFQNDWRYGIGLSVGAGSTPIVQRAVFPMSSPERSTSGVLLEGSFKGSRWTIAAVPLGPWLPVFGLKTVNLC